MAWPSTTRSGARRTIAASRIPRTTPAAVRRMRIREPSTLSGSSGRSVVQEAGGSPAKNSHAAPPMTRATRTTSVRTASIFVRFIACLLLDSRPLYELLPLLLRGRLQVEGQVVRLDVAGLDRHVHRAALHADGSAFPADAEVALDEDVLLGVVDDALAADGLALVRQGALPLDGAVDLALGAGDAGRLVDVAVPGVRVDAQAVRGAVRQAPRRGALPAGGRREAGPPGQYRGHLGSQLHRGGLEDADARQGRSANRRVPGRAVHFAREAADAEAGVG